MARDFGFAPTDKAPYYFISYNSQDAARVGAIAREMHTRGIPMWYDRGLIAGEEWEKQIALKIKNCREMVMFVTNKLMARENPYVRKEYSLAVKNHKKIYVVYLDSIDFEKVNIALQGWYVGLEYLHGIQAFDLKEAARIVAIMDNHIHFIENKSRYISQPKSSAKKNIGKTTKVTKNTTGKNIIPQKIKSFFVKNEKKLAILIITIVSILILAAMIQIVLLIMGVWDLSQSIYTNNYNISKYNDSMVVFRKIIE